MNKTLHLVNKFAINGLLPLRNSVRYKTAVADCRVLDQEVKYRESSGHSSGGRSFCKVNFDETSYYFQHGLRRVYPYYFTHRVFCKERWIGKSLVEMYNNEFVAATEESVEKRIASGHIRVNGQVIQIDYKLKDSDLITNSVHRHEMAVLAAPVKIVANDDEVLVIDKPPSVPVHPSGPFRHNTAVFILAKEHNLKGLYVVNRLDRLTSGIVLFAKSEEKVRQFNNAMLSREIQKEYMCRVEGLFPDGVVVCSEPLKIAKGKVSFAYVDCRGRPSRTEFERIGYNGKSSVVICRPLTGRTHQIRVHLQYLGHPIVNDPLYNSYSFGPMKGRGGGVEKSIEQVRNDIFKNSIPVETETVKTALPLNDLQTSILKSYNSTNEYYELSKQYVLNESKLHLDATCRYCNSINKDPVHRELFICLHAVRYKSDSFDYSTEIPEWAKSDWDIL